ncbi:uncharacterized protein LTR77_010485 [Saxophila tyrrhenica]|uniref:CFEM domain-containing protein n=1 Tax=Saxophila tyrrhenica TaxID=1690608 RepID=A0AAV9NZE8_9PEZI|nr:hypothetical protein LTR77_010485 [Saxophila tyrrhenica]
MKSVMRMTIWCAVLTASHPTLAAEALSPEQQEQQAAMKAAEALLKSMPTCGRECLLQSIAASPCRVDDLACSCSNNTITAEVEACVAASCTIRESLTTKNTTETLCQRPIRDRTQTVSYTGAIGGVLAVLAYILRMISRTPWFGGSPGLDDVVMTVAVLEVIPLSVLSVVLADLGLGKDIWTLPFENITHILKIYYFDEDLYLTSLPLVKVSMLLFYLRVFPQSWFRISAYITMACCVGYAIAFLLVSVFQCRPIHLAWEHWDREHPGSCNNINAQVWASAGLNIVLDIVVLSLPIPLVRQLALNRRKKMLLFSMFGIGFIVTAISIIRMQVLVQFGATSNFTWTYTSVGYWSTIETDLAIICACMPALRALLRHIFPKAMGDSTRGLSPGPPTPGQSGLSYSRQSRGSKGSRDVFKDDKNFYPLVEVNTEVDMQWDRQRPVDNWPL